MRRFSTFSASMLLVVAAFSQQVSPARGEPVRDKTLVAWVRLAPGNIGGEGVLTFEELPGRFDSIVYGEIVPERWMLGSDMFHRTTRDQQGWPAETAGPETTIQLAITTAGRDVRIYRDGKPYAQYQHEAEAFGFDPQRAIVLLGLRLIELTGPTFRGSILDARVYDHVLDADTIARLQPDVETPGAPRPLAWWDFQDGTTKDRMGVFPEGSLVGNARVVDSALHLDGGYMLVNLSPAPKREDEPWPSYHIAARPEEGLCRPYDPNGAIWWKGKYHLMYIYQDRIRPAEGHSWGHLVSTDLVNWTQLPPALVPAPGDADVGTFSGNAFINKEGVPMLCWFGIDAGVCVATAQDDDLITWKKHPKNPIIAMPKPGEPGHGQYRVWDPFLWVEGDRYVCLLGGNTLPNGKDTLDVWESPDLVTWTRRGPFYDHADLSWTGPGEDCSCPDFFAIGDRHALLCISHKVGARIYLGQFDAEKLRFTPDRHIRLNEQAAQFFAPESLLDGKGRRIVWAWVTDPRTIYAQRSAGSGVQSLPRVLELAPDGTLRMTPAEELKTLRREETRVPGRELVANTTTTIDAIRGDRLEIEAQIDPSAADQVGLIVRRSPDGVEQTGIWFDRRAGKLRIELERSTTRKDVVYTEGPLDTGGLFRAGDYPNPRTATEAPLTLAPGEPLRLRVFLDGPVLEVFANDRQAIAEQIFPERADSLGVAVGTRGGPAKLLELNAWNMAPARFEGR